MTSRANSDLILTEEQFRSVVGEALCRPISRSSLFGYRQELGLVKRELTLGFAQVVAYYVDLRSKRVPPARAKQLTIQFAKEQNL